jgi:hypothetical protein
MTDDAKKENNWAPTSNKYLKIPLKKVDSSIDIACIG